MKKCGFDFIFCFVLCMAASQLFAEHREYSRYESIVNRQMFGQPPDGFDPSKPPSEVQKTNSRGQKELSKEQEQIKKSVRFSMININPKGETMVGFTDSSDPKNVRNYYLKVGDTQDGWTVKSADAVEAKVSISKDGVDLDLELGGSTGGAPAKGNVPMAQFIQPQFGIRRNAPTPLNSSATTPANNMLGSLRERRLARMQQREAQVKADAEAQAKREAEKKEQEAREAEEKAQREAEREQTKQELQQLKDEIKKTREAAAAAKAPKDDANAPATAEE